MIFKGGNVKRASVSVVFENLDKGKGKCPLGYEKYDELIVSRTVEEGSLCKVRNENENELIHTFYLAYKLLCLYSCFLPCNLQYYLNSVLSTKKTIQEMFESVGLNVNNPNFMIMQGKITKVVNMKPKETLGMIEETVGASTYQTKRDKAMKDLEEKGKQVVEIQHVIILKLLRICLL